MDREGARGRPELQQLALDDQGRVGPHQEGAPSGASSFAAPRALALALALARARAEPEFSR
jgi:hypothetical protein